MPAGPRTSHSRPLRRLLQKLVKYVENETMRIGVGGGTGRLGALARAEFAPRGHAVWVLSRRAPGGAAAGAHRRVDLSTGDGLPEAQSHPEVVVDASNVARPGAGAEGAGS
jgi:hypothetical protein